MLGGLIGLRIQEDRDRKNQLLKEVYLARKENNPSDPLLKLVVVKDEDPFSVDFTKEALRKYLGIETEKGSDIITFLKRQDILYERYTQDLKSA